MIELNEGKHVSHNLTPDDIEFLKTKHQRHLNIKNNKIKASVYIGTINCPSGEKIIIHPKIPIKNILYLISYTYDLVKFYDKTELKDVTIYKSPIEMYLFVLLNWIEYVYKLGLLKSYNEIIQESHILKGKIMVNSKILTHGTFQSFHEEVTFSSLENRIIKSTLIYVSKKYKITNKTIEVRISRVLKIMQPVAPVKLSRKMFYSVNYNSLNRKYKRIHELCELIYTETFLKDDAGSKGFPSFLVNMQVVFQKFIFKVLENNLPKEKVIYQPRQKLFKSNEKKSKVNLIPDILIYRKLVVDTKYYKGAYGNLKYKMKQNDLFQINAYCDANSTSGLIVYAGDAESKPFKIKGVFNHNSFTISEAIFPINSPIEKFGENILSFIEKIKEHTRNLK